MIMMMDHSKSVPTAVPTPPSPPPATHPLMHHRGHHQHQQDSQLLSVPTGSTGGKMPESAESEQQDRRASPLSSPSPSHHSFITPPSPHIPSSPTPTNHSANNHHSKSIVTLSNKSQSHDAAASSSNLEFSQLSQLSPNLINLTTPTPPAPEGLEKIAKLLSGGASSEEDAVGFQNASQQLLAAAVAAAAVVASGNVSALSPQEQWLATMAPTLIQVISQNQQSGAMESPGHSSADEDSQSNAQSCKSSSSSAGKRRKQSKPVRYQDEPMFDSLRNRSKELNSREQQATIAGSQDSRQAELSDQLSAMMSEAEEEDEDEDETEEEAERSVEAATSVPEKNQQSSSDEECEAGQQRVERGSRKHQSATTKSSSTTVSATAAADYQEEDDALREKEQQLLLANMFANLQQKLIHSVFCPQCNCPCANEDQLRAHIEIEHMQKLQFLSNAAADAAAAAVAASGANPNSAEAMQFRQLAEHLAMQKFQEQMHQERLNQRNGSSRHPGEQHSKQRKRKLARSPSSRSVSSDSSNSSSNSIDRKASEDSNLEQDLVDGGQLSPPVAKSRKHNSKDLNHNLLQSLNHLPANLISPLISSLNGSKSVDHNSPHSLLSASRLGPSGSPPSPPDQISPLSEQYGRLSGTSSPPSNPAAAFASMFPSMPPSMAPFLLPMLSQSRDISASSVGAGHPFGGPSLREHHASQSSHFGASVPSHHQSSSAMLNGVSSATNSSAAAAAAAAATLRIFNPEAYCELCNKEFCNKYFLKTHKANKHGIYTPEPNPNDRSSSSSGSEARGSSNVPSSVRSSNSPLLPSNGMSALMPAVSLTSQASNGPTGLKASPNPASLPSDHLFNQSQSSPGQTGPGLLPPGFPGGPMRLNLNMNMINLDSYCEICQKEFCNKYFLKKHKQKIHGFVFQGEQVIPPPNLAAQIAQSQQQLQQQSQQPSPSQLQQLQQLHLLQQQLVQREREMERATRLSPSPLDSVDLKQFRASPVNGQLSVITSTGAIASADKSPLLKPVTSDPSSVAAPGAIAPEKLHSMGVINPDAFCEICCKEFCNKYFLKTHMVNKHGVFDGQLIPGKFPSNNLLVNANLTNGSRGEGTRTSGEDTGLEPGQRDPSTYGKDGNNFLSGFSSTSSSSSGIACEQCALRFPTSYLLNVHKFYQHNIPYDKRRPAHSVEAEEEGEEVEADGDQLLRNTKAELVDSDVETEISGMPSLLVSAELNHETSSQHSNSSNLTKDGQDLQKLRSMIKGLTGAGDISLDSMSRNGDESIRCACHICKYECDNRYYLRAHLINEHNFPNSEEAFLTMFSATSGMNFLDHPSKQSDLMGGNASSEAYCEICNKEFCSKYFLKTHKQKIHNINMDGPPGQNGTPPEMPPALLSSLYQAAALQQQQQQHSQKSQSPKFSSPGHSSNPTIAATIKAAIAAGLVPNSDPAGGASTGQKSAVRGPVMTGRNYCNICNKELCNKYFMKTHMLKMHNINIDEHPIEAQQSSTIGGVQCDICQKELCSKYFLKVHKQNTHGIYEDGTAPPVLLGPSERTPFPPASGSGRNGPSSGSSRGKTMLPPSNGPSSMMAPDSLSALNPMLFMSMMQSAAVQAQAQANVNDSTSDSNSVCSTNSEKEAKINGLDPVADAGNRLLSVYQEVCQMCERRFKSDKWRRLHMLNEHPELVQLLSVSEQLTANMAQSGPHIDSINRLCFVCGQTFEERTAMHVHLIKAHKVTVEELMVNFSNSFKLATIMAAAAQMQQHQDPNPSDLSLRMTPSDLSREDSPARRTPHSRSSTPSSPKPDDFDSKRALLNGSNPMQNPAAALQNFLLKQSGINPMALLAAAQAGTIPPALISAIFGGVDPNKLDFPSDDYSAMSRLSLSTPSGHGNTKNPPGKFVCQICFRTYRHSHSLQRHMITHRPKPGSTQPQSGSPPPIVPSPNASSAPVTPSTDSKPDQNGTRIGTGEKPRNKRYRCSKCNKKFRTRELCLVHIRALHSIVNNPIQTNSQPNLVQRGIVSPDRESPAAASQNNATRKSFNAVKFNAQEDEEQEEEEQQPMPLNLRATPEPSAATAAATMSQHQLPPSPSVSSEDDQLNGHQHRQTRTMTTAPLPASRTSPYLPQSPVEDEEEEEEEEEEQDVQDHRHQQKPKDLSSQSFAHKIMDLSSNNSNNADNDSELDSPASPDPQQITRPSLICVNGEKY